MQSTIPSEWERGNADQSGTATIPISIYAIGNIRLVGTACDIGRQLEQLKHRALCTLPRHEG